MDRALYVIADILQGRGFTLAQVGLPCPITVPSEIQSELDWFADRLPELRAASRARRLQFNSEQAAVYEALIATCQSNEPQPPIFLDGKAGRGKTFLVECLTWRLRSRQEIVLITGTTALSVIGYDRGRTAHSAFGIPVKEINGEFSCRVRPDSGQAKLICAAKLIIWDELPMANRAAVEAVDILSQQLKENQRSLGGGALSWSWRFPTSGTRGSRLRKDRGFWTVLSKLLVFGANSVFIVCTTLCVTVGMRNSLIGWRTSEKIQQKQVLLM